MDNQYKHLFWDLDHTLWDFESNSKNTLAVVYKHFNIERLGILDFDAFSVIYEEYNEALWVQLRAGTISRTLLRWKRMDLALSHYGIHDEALAKRMSELYLEVLPLQKQLMPGALEVLEYCVAKGYQSHIITNGFETTQQLKLANSGLKDYFGHLFTSELVNAMKPHAPIFHHALSVVAANSKEVIMIGDSLEADIIGARNIQMDQIFYNPLRVAHNEKITYEVMHLNEIMKIL